MDLYLRAAGLENKWYEAKNPGDGGEWTGTFDR